MVSKEIQRFLERIKPSKTKIREMKTADVSFVVDCVMASMKEFGRYIDPHAEMLMVAHFLNLDEEKVFISSIDGVDTGIVCCYTGHITPWDTRLAGIVCELYVIPEYRKTDSLKQLLHKAITYLASKGVLVYNILAGDENLVKNYKSLFGMKVTEHDYVMES